MDSSVDRLAKILQVDPNFLDALDEDMSRRTGRTGTLRGVVEEADAIMARTLALLDSNNRSSEHVRSVLRKTILSHEKQLMVLLESIEGKTEFERAARLAKRIAKVERGFFLKRERARAILEERKPEHLLEYLHVGTVAEALQKHDIVEIFSTLRFIESDEWMHQTFDIAYSNFTAEDFEERDIEIRVLGPEWKTVSQAFVAKKHHNVSHLKEFGVIFLNPISEDIPGKFLRDFALLLHYVHEIEFYSKLFKKYVKEPGFAEKFKQALRGDVPSQTSVNPGEWLIVQRYLEKLDPHDKRLYIPHVNPESMHWIRGERDLTTFEASGGRLDLKLWHNLDWVGGIFADGKSEVVSFDLEDTAMSLVSFMEGKNESFNYHEREALWTKIFMEYAGGESRMEELLIENFDKGIIKF